MLKVIQKPLDFAAKIAVHSAKEVYLTTNNSNGVFHEQMDLRGNMKEVVNWKTCSLINVDTGYLSKDISPKFQNQTYENYKWNFDNDQSIRFLEPMGANEYAEYEDSDEDLAELKRDGHRGLIYIGENIAAPFNRSFTRYVSSVTGWYGESSDNVPHFRDLDMSEFAGTVLDGEFDYDETSSQVSSVMLSLPENAIQHQFKNGFIPFYAFDILYYKGINIQAMPLWKRKVYLARVVSYVNEILQFPLLKMQEMSFTQKALTDTMRLWESYVSKQSIEPEVYRFLFDNSTIVPSYNEEFRKLVKAGKEGMIVKKINGRYHQKKCDSSLKLKGKSTWDVVFMGLSEPEAIYTGKKVAEGTLNEWKYWYHPESDSIVIIEDGMLADEHTMEHCDPITKPKAMGWCGGIRCGVFKELTDEDYMQWMDECGGEIYAEIAVDQMKEEGSMIKIDGKTYILTEVATIKGLDEATMIDLKENWMQYVIDHRVLSVTANALIDKSIGSLRHPRFHEWRDDKPAEKCTFEDHIRKREGDGQK